MMCRWDGVAKDVCVNLRVADTFWERFMGLMGSERLHENEGLWIQSCNSIHTCFMKFPIDAIFLDSAFRIVSVREDISPFRFIFPQRGATSVLELQSGSVRRLDLKVGMECLVQ